MPSVRTERVSLSDLRFSCKLPGSQSEKDNITTIISLLIRKDKTHQILKESKAFPRSEFQKTFFMWDFV